jgi:putative intracellular protease/amidase
MTKALFVASTADHWTLNDGTEHRSGFWGEELAMPHKVFTEAEWENTVAPPGGKAPRWTG